MTNSLSRLMLVTERKIMPPSFAQALESGLEAGASLIQFREKDLDYVQALELARAAKESCDRLGARLVINSNLELALGLNAGWHCPAQELQKLAKARLLLGPEALLGASCHSSEECLRAGELGASYVVFGSIFPTDSHKGTTPVGLERLAEITAQLEIPVFAIGGITTNNVSECLNAGAYGVAVIRAVWKANNISNQVRELLRLLGEPVTANKRL
jgi:thiamine-phosphate pyrophosphorylase